MRIMFFGTSSFGVPSLERLVASGHEICRCVTQPDRPQGRGLLSRSSPIKTAALRLGLAVIEPEHLSDCRDPFQALQSDLGVVVSYGKLVPGWLLRAPRLGMVGIHPSLLPKYRGASPIARAILDGETSTGISIFMLTEALDAGDVVVQHPVPLGPEETTETLTARLAGLSAEALLEAIEALSQGRARPIAQDQGQATYAAKFSKEDGRIDWQQDAARIHRLIRATTPWPGAYTYWRGERLKIVAARAEEPSHDGQPGVVSAVGPSGIVVDAGRGRLVIEQAQPAGKRRMSAAEFLAGHQLKIGERFGEARNESARPKSHD